MESTKTIRIGPAGWSYSDWEGIVYPPHGSKFDHLAYLAQYFDTIEVNSSFYRIPPVTHSRSWVRRVEANDLFRFTIKMFRGFTHESAPPSADDVKAFRAVLDPMAEAGRLGAVLVQFPWSFKSVPEARERLENIFRDFAAYPLALEVRHGSFQRDDFYAFLSQHEVAFVNIDQPLFGDSVRPSDIVTSDLSYVRFHGRNYEKWFAHEESWERYNYLYSANELQPWVGRIEALAQGTDVYAITNNHFRGQAIVNAIDLKRATGQRADVPPQLSEHYGPRVTKG